MNVVHLAELGGCCTTNERFNEKFIIVARDVSEDSCNFNFFNVNIHVKYKNLILIHKRIFIFFPNFVFSILGSFLR